MAAAGVSRCLQGLDLLQELQFHSHIRSTRSQNQPSKPLRFACNADLPRNRSRPAFLAGGLPLPSTHQNKHRFLLNSKNGGRTAFAESKEKRTPSISSAASDLNDRDRAKKSAGNQDRKESTKGDDDDGAALASGGALAGGLLILTLATMGGLGFFYKDQINAALIQFQGVLETLGPIGYVYFLLAYAGLEVLAIPAIPLTMSAGLLFGQATGTVIVSAAGTLAATVSFLIARYVARDRILKIAEKNPKFLAIDKAIGKESFKVVTLLRLSPLLPFSVGNYIYGLTSVKLAPYVLGSWIGMLPGTFAYVSAGSVGKTLLQESAEGAAAGPSGHVQLITLGLGLLATVGATWYVGKLAKTAVDDID